MYVILPTWYCDVCNFADDTTPFVYHENLDFGLTELEKHSHCVKSVQIRIQENTDQKKLRIWTLSTQCQSLLLNGLRHEFR